jgi:DNA-binding transcriptional regulator YhcF (GntR family)
LKINIDSLSSTPKYRQIVNQVIEAIQSGSLSAGHVLPSINELSFELDISRMTIEKAYNELKIQGLISSQPGKGYYLSEKKAEQNYQVLLLFNKLSQHKKIIYDSFVETLGNKATIDFYVYNNDVSLFKKILKKPNIDHYSHYVILPHFLEEDPQVFEFINALPKEKLIILDKLYPQIKGNFAAIYEDFENDIFGALEDSLNALQKYQTLKLIFPKPSYHPNEIAYGFKKFCTRYNFNYSIVENVEFETISKGDVFINLREEDLFILLEKVTEQDFVLGQEIGLISYNETLSKRFILSGLSTMSTDFEHMGSTTARFIMESHRSKKANPFSIILRASL